MSTAKPPYDPVKTVEGMFNGSVTRIAYVMKDPLNYAQSTKAVLAETAKKFQDALDDCEIQLLDAKWYLERQLALNKERRKTKAREDTAAVSAKRKLDDIKDSKDKTQDSAQDPAPKRVKTAEPEESAPAKEQPLATTTAPPTAPVSVSPIMPKQVTKPLEKPPVPKPAEKPQSQSQPLPAAPPTGTNRKPSISTDVKTQPTVAPIKPKPKHKPPTPIHVPPPAAIPTSEPLTTQSFTLEDYPRATPQDTPAGGNEDFNFVSMFGEPSGNDMMDGTGGDMGFDMNIGNEFDIDPTAAAAAQDSSLTSLLPGLESYANQTGDDNSFNLGGINMNGTPGTLDIHTNPLQMQPQLPVPGVNMGANDFGLPTLGPNEFDEFLNDNDMNFDAVDDGMMNMDNMDTMDMDFDSMFK